MSKNQISKFDKIRNAIKSFVKDFSVRYNDGYMHIVLPIGVSLERINALLYTENVAYRFEAKDNNFIYHIQL